MGDADSAQISVETGGLDGPPLSVYRGGEQRYQDKKSHPHILAIKRGPDG